MPKEIILAPKDENFFSLDSCLKSLEAITDHSTEKFVIETNFENKWLLFNFGMLFAYLHYTPDEKEIIPSKKIEKTPYKSFGNVLLDMVENGIKGLPNYKINSKKAFIIGPVRNVDKEKVDSIRKYKRELLEKNLFEIVHYPLDDTNQQDPIGINICKENLEAEASSGTIMIFYCDKSLGSVFDLGAFFMLKYHLDNINYPYEKRKIRILNYFNPKNNYERFLLQLSEK